MSSQERFHREALKLAEPPSPGWEHRWYEINVLAYKIGPIDIERYAEANPEIIGMIEEQGYDWEDVRRRSRQSKDSER